jgi:hypothetical protein
MRMICASIRAFLLVLNEMTIQGSWNWTGNQAIERNIVTYIIIAGLHLFNKEGINLKRVVYA